MALQDVVVEPMHEDFVLWRCLHGGPLSAETIDRLPADDRAAWEAHRVRNVPLLQKIIRAYGTCALLAWDGAEVVGFLRFYPQALFAVEGAGQLCLQQEYPAGASDQMVAQRFPSLPEIADRTLQVHCLMTGSPFQAQNPYQRRGLGSRMVRALMRWGREQGWEGIEAAAFEDLPILYANTGQAGRRFWERLGFHLVRTEIGPPLDRENAFVRTMLEEAAAQGLDPPLLRNTYTMRIDLS